MKQRKTNSIVALLLCMILVLSVCDLGNITAHAEEGTLIEYSGHQQNIGNISKVADGAILGQIGKSLRMEAITVFKGSKLTGLAGDIQCQAHVQNIGTTRWIGSGNAVGSTGKSQRIEAIRFRLTGEIAENYDIYYSAHIQNVGWSRWVKGLNENEQVGGWCGTEGLSMRIEAIKIKLVPVASGAPDDSGTFTHYSTSEASNLITYKGHQQNYGDLPAVSDGDILGITGKSLRFEALSIDLTDKQSANDSIQYRVHIQNIGWQDWRSDGQLAGTTGQSLRLEAVEIKLAGDISNKYDVWYRVHAQNVGWMGWAKNGQSAGTAGYSRRLEAIQIRLIPKGLSAPGTTAKAFLEKKYSGKLIALTFDDGPGARCSEILDCLEQNGAHATFYVVGSNARLRSALLTRMESIGCEVGNHTNSHTILSRVGAGTISGELESVNSTLRSTLGHNAVTMRPPGGGCNSTVQATVGVPIILWSIDTLDWKTRNTAQTVNCVLNNAKDGDIVLMHDIHSPSVDAALILIPELQKRGFTLVTVSELAEAKGVTLQPGQVYNSIR